MSQNNKTVRAGGYTPGQKRARIKVLISSVIFYLILAVYIYVFIAACKYGYGLLMDWLAKLEASQPDVRCEEIFNELFAEPDWAELYTLAGEEDTIYEGADAYASYMENLVGNSELTYVETSAGLSGDKKYIVKLDSAKIAEFTLTNQAPEGEEVPDWQLGEVAVFYTRQEDAYIFTVPGHTVYINGVALDDSFTVKTTFTVVEDYLQEYYSSQLHGYRDMTLYIDGLLVQPQVTILDENGNSMEVTYDAETNTYRETVVTEKISEELHTVMVNACQAYGKYMIAATNKTNMQNFFDPQGSVYKGLPAQWELWVQNYLSYEFTEAMVTDYYRYNEELFSARISMTLRVTRTNGTIKEYDLDTTFFVEKNAAGKWLVDRMTNVDIQETTSLVKLVYMSGSNAICTEWVDANATQVTLPELQVPSGKTFLGWFTKSVNGKDITYSLVFGVSEDGIIYLPEGNVLQPMVLYAQFQ